MTSARSEIGRFARHSAIYAIGNVLNRVGAFLLLPLYTRFLTPGEYGVLELYYAVAAVISGVLSAGIAHATLRFYFDYQDERSRSALISTNLLAALGIGAAGACVVAWWREDLARLVFGDPAYARGMALVLAALVLELGSEVCLAYIRARERSTLFVLLAGARLAVQLVANYVLVVGFGAGVQGVLLGNLGAVAVVCAILLFHTLRECGIAFHPAKLVPVLRYSFPFLLSTLVGIVSANIDRFLINGLLTLQALGIYALALKFSKLLGDLIGEPFSRAYGAFRFTIMGTAQAAPIQARLVRYLLAASSTAGLAVLFFTGELLAVMSDRAFWPAADLLPMLVLAAIAGLIAYPLQSGILFHKKSRHIFTIALVNAVARALACALLIDAFGLNGACAAVLVAALVNLILTELIAQRFFPVKYEYGRLAYILLTGCAFYAASRLVDGLPWGVAVGAKAALLAGYVAALLASPAFDRQETADLWAMISRKKTLSGSTAAK